jgi:tRNA(Ile2) C34 agmatinyltransferase TiaS
MECKFCDGNIEPENVDGTVVYRCEKCGRAMATGDKNIQKAKDLIDGNSEEE